MSKLLSPGLCVPFVTSFEEHHDDSAFEAAGNVSRMHAFSSLFGELPQDFFGIEDADVGAHL